MIIHFDLLDSQMHYYNRKSGKRRARASFVRTIKKKNKQTISRRRESGTIETKCKVIETNNYNRNVYETTQNASV